MWIENVILQMQAESASNLAFFGYIQLIHINKVRQEERTKSLKCFGLETGVSSR